MPIKIQSNKAQDRFPRLSIFIGLPKIGKSTAMAKLPKALILDLEGKGYDAINVSALVKATELKDVYDAVAWFFSEENKDFKILVIDHLRALTSMFAKQITKEYDARFVEDVQYGRGIYQLKNTIDSFIKKVNERLAQQDDKMVMFVGHAVDRNNEIRLDIDGKNETLVLGLVDAVGYISRDNEGNTTVNFSARRGVEFGTRNQHLANYDGVLDWAKLFKLAKGEK